MFEIYDVTDFGAHPIVTTSGYDLNKIHHFLDWLMGREPIYKAASYNVQTGAIEKYIQQ
jgi:hypothetical protein